MRLRCVRQRKSAYRQREKDLTNGREKVLTIRRDNLLTEEEEKVLTVRRKKCLTFTFLPYKTPQGPRREQLGRLRIVTFALSFLYVLVLTRLYPDSLERLVFISFIVGNILYYAVGIALAFAFKDNRAFCKYLCPVAVFLKPASYFSVIRIKVNEDTCISCGKCKAVCPMEVDMLDASRSRKNGTECILCLECRKVCPTKSI